MSPRPFPHMPHRGSDVEKWIKARRDAEMRQYGSHVSPPTPAWHAYDDLLDEYRLRADTGLMLGEDIALAGEGR